MHGVIVVRESITDLHGVDGASVRFCRLADEKERPLTEDRAFPGRWPDRSTNGRLKAFRSTGLTTSPYLHVQERSMSDDVRKDRYSRRGFLGIGSAAVAAAGLLSGNAAADQQQSEKARTDRSASTPVQTN